MKPGAIVRLPGERIGTVVYHGLDGYGIMWGRVNIDRDSILGANPLFGNPPEGYQFIPEAMLRKPYKSTEELECVGDEFEIIEERSNELLDTQ